MIFNKFNVNAYVENLKNVGNFVIDGLEKYFVLTSQCYVNIKTALFLSDNQTIKQSSKKNCLLCVFK